MACVGIVQGVSGCMLCFRGGEVGFGPLDRRPVNGSDR
jgi:hypothetical protein